MSLIGTFRKWRDVRLESVVGSKPEVGFRGDATVVDPERTFDLNGLLTWPNTFLK